MRIGCRICIESCLIFKESDILRLRAHLDMNKNYPRLNFVVFFLIRTGIAFPPLLIAVEDISLPLISVYMSVAFALVLVLLFFILENRAHVKIWWNPLLTLLFWLVVFVVSVLALFGYPPAWIAIPILIDSTWNLNSYFIHDPYADPVVFDPTSF